MTGYRKGGKALPRKTGEGRGGGNNGRKESYHHRTNVQEN